MAALETEASSRLESPGALRVDAGMTTPLLSESAVASPRGFATTPNDSRYIVSIA
jgi:hypothetical protein